MSPIIFILFIGYLNFHLNTLPSIVGIWFGDYFIACPEFANEIVLIVEIAANL